ncbi:hypothetical protein TNCV_971511 [Trichonephila clavipes]|nr:hypothetical protein TNCV_971511 [Trichonephila clavipes]
MELIEFMWVDIDNLEMEFIVFRNSVVWKTKFEDLISEVEEKLCESRADYSSSKQWFVRVRIPFGDRSLEGSKHLFLVLPTSVRGAGGRRFFASRYILLVTGKGSLMMSKVDG